MAVYHLGELSSGFARGMLAKQQGESQDRRDALALLQSLASAPPEQEDLFRAMLSQAYPNVKITGRIPRAPKPMLDRPARDQFPDAPEGMPLREYLNQRPDLAEKIYGKAAETEQVEFDRLLKAHQFAEQRQGKKVPISGRLLDLSKKLGISLPTETVGAAPAQQAGAPGEPGQGFQAAPAQPGVEREIIAPPTPRPTFGTAFPQTRGTPLGGTPLPIKQDSHGNVEIDWAAARNALQAKETGTPKKEIIVNQKGQRVGEVTLNAGETLRIVPPAKSSDPEIWVVLDAQGNEKRRFTLPPGSHVTRESTPPGGTGPAGPATQPGGQDEYTQETYRGPRGLPQTRWKNKAGAYFTEEQMRARANGGDQKAAIAIGSGGRTTRDPALIQRELNVNYQQEQAARARKDANSLAALANRRVELEAELADARGQHQPAPKAQGDAARGAALSPTQGLPPVVPAGKNMERAQAFLKTYQQTKQPVPKAVWAKLDPDEQAFLTKQGVQVEK